MRKCLLLLVTVLLLCMGTGYAQKDPSRESLEGLHGFYVTVDGLTPEAESDGLVGATIKTETELALRKTNVKVYEHEEWMKDINIATLSVVFDIIKRGDLYSYTIRVSVRQVAALVRNPKKTVTVDTWYSGTFGAILSSNVKDLSETVKKDVDKLLNDYLAAKSDAEDKQKDAVAPAKPR